MADIKIKASPDEIQQAVSAIAPPMIPPAPPPPPMPTPARAGYGAFASDPLNQSAVSKHISPPNTPILPPPPSIAAPQPWNPQPSSIPSSIAAPQEMASVNPPRPQFASLNPPKVDTLASTSTPMLPYSPVPDVQAPQTVSAYGTPTESEYFAANPSQQDTPLLAGQGLKRGLLYGAVGALQSLGSGLQRGGNPLAGMNFIDRTLQHDQNAPTVNTQRYRNAVIQPQIDAQRATQTAATVAHEQAQTGDIGAKHQLQLSKLGLKEVPNPITGGVDTVPDTDSPVYKTQQAKDAKMALQTQLIGAQIDNTKAQKTLRDAQTAFENMKGDPKSIINQQIAQRLATAQQNANTSAGRLNQSQLTYQARYLGTGANGEALPGTMITDDGQPVGSAFSQNVRPTGTQRNKGNMADSAADQLTTIKNIMEKHPTLFGPGYGQTSAFRQWIGSQDPDAQRWKAARTIAGDHLAGTFGGRSEAALDALDKAIGQFKDNPKAALAGVDQLITANSRFQAAGTVRTTGSAAGKKPNLMVPPAQSSPQKGTMRTYKGHPYVFDGKQWNPQ